MQTSSQVLETSDILVPCAHCGLPTNVTKKRGSSEGSLLSGTTPVERVFCCNGCMGAYALIHEMGLEDYYKLRRDSGSHYVRESDQRVAALSDLEAAGVPVHHLPGGFDCVRLSVDGMHCAACSWLIERMQPTIRGLQSARVRLSDHSVELIYDPRITNVARVASRLAKIGYELTPWQDDPEQNTEIVQKQREHWVGIATAAFLAANAMWIGIALYAGEATGITPENEYFLRWVGTILGLASAVFPGRIFFSTAIQAIKSRSPHVDIPVAISLMIGTICALYGAWTGLGHVYFDSLASLVLLLRIGRYLQFRAQSKAKTSIAQLMRWNTSVAQRLDEHGNRHAVPSSRLAPGDLILVEPGEVIPADGYVESGESSLDTSLLTGETLPVLATIQSKVVGGTTNLTSPITVRVDASGENSRVGKLMAMVRDATTYKTPWIQAADRVGRWFVIVVLTLAAFTWIGWNWKEGAGIATQHTMALLTIACPCALALAAPLVVTIALGRAAKRQIWIRDGDTLEKLAVPGMLWFDKTGTLTLGKMHVLSWTGNESDLAMLAAVEMCVHHPVASAIVKFAEVYASTQIPVEVSNVVQERGFGVRACVDGREIAIGNLAWMERTGTCISDDFQTKAIGIANAGLTPIWVSIQGQLAGLFSVGDALRPDTVETLRHIQSMGWKLGILSGDNQAVVDQIVRSLQSHGIQFENALGGQSPEDKLSVIQKSRRNEMERKEDESRLDGTGVAKRSYKLTRSPSIDYHPVAMIGDGVNDAAALAAADIGIAVRGNSDQCLAVAPIYIANPRLSSIVELIQASRYTVAGIRRCFAASLLYNAITISLAVAGLIHPLIAALFMPLSGVTVLTMALKSKSFSRKPLLGPR